jgi:hypothetical protein
LSRVGEKAPSAEEAVGAVKGVGARAGAGAGGARAGINVGRASAVRLLPLVWRRPLSSAAWMLPVETSELKDTV